MTEAVEGQEVPKTKQELLENFRQSRKKLMDSVKKLRKRDYDAKTLDGWSVRDVLAHVIEWDIRSIDDSRMLRQGEEIDTSHLEDNDTFNREALEQYDGWSVDDILTGLGLSTQRVASFLHHVREDDLDKGTQMFAGDRITPRWMMDYPYHDDEHAQQITAWREKNGL